MTKKEGMILLDSIIASLEGNYQTLEELYDAVQHPVSEDVQAKADIVLKAGISISCMALNFKEIPAEAKKPFAAFLYTAADALSDKGDEK